jgi:hypothetical protein
MENFNSLGVLMSNTKINAMNKLCREFNTNVIAGCKSQVDWPQAMEEQQFRNPIGVGMETRIILAHNMSKQMQRNQHGRCAMIEMGQLSEQDVVETGVGPYGQGQWCLIVMTYQPSGSSSTNSAGTTVREQYEQYFEAKGDMRSARSIFFDQVIPQLVV